MVLADVPAVVELERRAVAHGWSAEAYERELAQNGAARYLVLARDDPPALVGFGGLWLGVDEAHIVTVAIDAAERRCGYGALIVLGLLDLAIEHGMTSATLEVRVSNDAARALYRRFGFWEVGERRRYYADNGEDAIIMTTPDFRSPRFRETLEGQRTRCLAQHPELVRAAAVGAD